MKKDPQHIIRQLIYEVNIHEETIANQVQERISRLQQQVTDLLETLFVELTPPETVIKIDTMDIDLGDITIEDFEQEMLQRIRQQILLQMPKGIHLYTSKPPAPVDALSVNENQWEAIRFFLSRGYLPWWFPVTNHYHLEEEYLKMIHEHPALSKGMLSETIYKQEARKRMVYQFSDHSIRETINLLEPSNYAFITTYADDLLHAHGIQPLIKLSIDLFGKLRWDIILLYLLEESGGSFNKKAMIKRTLYNLASASSVKYEDFLLFLTRIIKMDTAKFTYKSQLPAMLLELQEELLMETGYRQVKAETYLIIKQFLRILNGEASNLSAYTRDTLLHDLLRMPVGYVRSLLLEKLWYADKRYNLVHAMRPGQLYKILHILSPESAPYLPQLSYLLLNTFIPGFRLTEKRLLEYYFEILSYNRGKFNAASFIRDLLQLIVNRESIAGNMLLNAIQAGVNTDNRTEKEIAIILKNILQDPNWIIASEHITLDTTYTIIDKPPVEQKGIWVSPSAPSEEIITRKLIRQLEQWLNPGIPTGSTISEEDFISAYIGNKAPALKQRLWQQLKDPAKREILIQKFSIQAIQQLIQFLYLERYGYIQQVWQALVKENLNVSHQQMAGILLEFLSVYQTSQVNKETFIQYVLLKVTHIKGESFQPFLSYIYNLPQSNSVAKDIRQAAEKLFPEEEEKQEAFTALTEFVYWLVTRKPVTPHISQWITELATHKPGDFRKMLRQHGRNSIAQKHLAVQLNEQSLEKIIQVLLPRQADQVMKHTTDLLEVQEQSGIVQASTAAVKTIWWELVLHYLLGQSATGYNEKSFLQHTLLLLTRRFSLDHGSFLAFLMRILSEAPYAGKSDWKLPQLVKEVYEAHQKQLPKPQLPLTKEAKAIFTFLQSGEISGLTLEEFYQKFNSQMADLMQNRPEEMRELLSRVGNRFLAVKRVTLLAEDPLVNTLIRLLAPDKAALLQAYREALVKNDLVKLFPAAQQAALQKARDELLLTYLLEKRSSVFNTKSFMKASIARIALSYQLTYDVWIAYITRFAMEAGLDAGFRALMQEISYEARKEVPKPLPKLPVPDVYHPPAEPNPTQAVEKKEDKPLPWKKEKAIELGEKVYVANAGIIILWPYLNLLFSRLGWMENNSFISEETAFNAVHILQYMATGEQYTPENLLMLNKVLCGLELHTPILPGYALKEEEVELVEGLLKAVVQNWKIIGNTSIAGLRETFLQREGVLTRYEDHWHLKIGRQAFDMLIDRLPWSISMLKLSWMKWMLKVEWQL